ncbi:hypothetical protein HHK36_003366 [Tetracentron sinense]|uniref:C2 domain-containing protein n=1 Tax=Tetracentron sinense TaxID=13715 RepID=A0A834ZNK9_TETSI|nr:hypothetical protein HHK36_003366 [Tetracentron sinense]
MSIKWMVEHLIKGSNLAASKSDKQDALGVLITGCYHGFSSISHIISSFKNCTVVTKPEIQKSDSVIQNSGSLSRGIGVHRKEVVIGNLEDVIGILEVYIHQDKDIHNICIYQNQDVYAKLFLTSDPETTVLTQIINGGGKNSVFNENLKLNVRTKDSSIKLRLAEVLVGNEKSAQEFALSSSDLFHSPAGFVQLSLSYSGASPEVMAIPVPHSSIASNIAVQDLKLPDSLPSDYNIIEYPDPEIENENHLMVSEYFGIPCTKLDSQSSESLDTSDTNNPISSDNGVCVVESFSAISLNSIHVPVKDTPPSCISTNGSPSASIPASSQAFFDTPGASKSPTQDLVSPLKENGAVSSVAVPSNTFSESVLSVEVEPEKTVVQQDIVDMYMKSMHQFTDSLAKLKVPMDMENGASNSGNSISDEKLEASKGTGLRVFYGCRAFF